MALKASLGIYLVLYLIGPTITTCASHPHFPSHPLHHNRHGRQCQNRLPKYSDTGVDGPETPYTYPSTNTLSTDTTIFPSVTTAPNPTIYSVSSIKAEAGSVSTSISSSDLTRLASTSVLIPNGKKAGVAGGDAYNLLIDHIGWWYDWSANPSKPGKPIAVPMLWGVGKVDGIDAKRLAQFQRLSASASSASHPKYVLGYEEPDCTSGGGSSGISVAQGVKEWEALMAPLKKKGTIIGSPSMCKQADETWLKEFSKKISTSWDFTAIHVNKNNLAGVKKDIDHYWTTYGKPIWVTEFACVNDFNTFQPCTNQAEINAFVPMVVDYFEHDSRVYAYAFSNGEGLGNVWPMMRNGVISESGNAYLAAISKYH